jgi:flavodoxin
MKYLVVYDSIFGNTEKIALAIGRGLSSTGEGQVLRVGDVSPDQIKGLDLLVAGSPTRAFQPTPAMKDLLKRLPSGELKGVKAGAFDTRIAVDDTTSGFLKFMIRLFGYAAAPIGKGLAAKGAALTAPPEGFFVTDSEGPLKEGELERAEAWAGLLASA